ncbi:hypothetical protein K2173_016936 [Erythroxylum novogranatense]|uniref:Alkyl transferase n=1 Tax=Erythroxylum novogranatense TaxID=1862640 RepID=A0AAV8U5D2_9ROSI|nr:hypothetical protein K2173_016936 [Erythroxylum novogranatense]
MLCTTTQWSQPLTALTIPDVQHKYLFKLSPPVAPILPHHHRGRPACVNDATGPLQRATDIASAIKEEEKSTLQVGLLPESMPKHVGVIIDGHRRWSRSNGVPMETGYEIGFGKIGMLMQLCIKFGVKVLTTFILSTNSCKRPQVEVETMLNNFDKILKQEMETFVRDNIRVTIIGDTSRLSDSLQQLIVHTEETTKNNNGLHVMFAVNYSGQYDIVQACKRVAVKVKDGLVDPKDIDESLMNQEMETRCTQFSDLDLLIRPGKEQRVSGFFLWQLSYTELYFPQIHGPDFGEADFVEALRYFQARERRFGSV